MDVHSAIVSADVSEVNHDNHCPS